MASARNAVPMDLMISPGSDGGAGVEAGGVVPEELSLSLCIHRPVRYQRDRLGEVALAVRIVRGVHQHMIAYQIDDGVGQLGALRDLNALEIMAAGDVFAR